MHKYKEHLQSIYSYLCMYVCVCVCVYIHIYMFLGFSWEHQMNFLDLKQVIKDKVKHNKYHN